MVEHLVANEMVMGSSPIGRLIQLVMLNPQISTGYSTSHAHQEIGGGKKCRLTVGRWDAIPETQVQPLSLSPVGYFLRFNRHITHLKLRRNCVSDLQHALELAIEAHKGQRQKNGLPYVLHPLKLMLAMGSDEARIAAVLHDVIEDTHWGLNALREAGFSESVVNALDCLTHRKSEKYGDYIERVATNPIAREVKMADLEDNMNILRIPSDLKQNDLNRLKKYHKAWFRLNALG